MLRSKHISEIVEEIEENLRKYVFEIETEECNMCVVEHRLVLSELELFSEYDEYGWREFEESFPRESGTYWLTVIDNNDDKKVVTAQWYNQNSLRFWKGKYKELIAWKLCILPEPYR